MPPPQVVPAADVVDWKHINLPVAAQQGIIRCPGSHPPELPQPGPRARHRLAPGARPGPRDRSRARASAR